MKIVTINTDAGFYPFDKVGSYAYWIKAENLFLRGSGIFKTKCTNPTEAECKAIINALHILYVSNYKAEKIIINREAHLHTNTPKHWVNDWCDKQCKLELKKWKAENKKL